MPYITPADRARIAAKPAKMGGYVVVGTVRHQDGSGCYDLLRAGLRFRSKKIRKRLAMRLYYEHKSHCPIEPKHCGPAW